MAPDGDRVRHPADPGVGRGLDRRRGGPDPHPQADLQVGVDHPRGPDRGRRRVALGGLPPRGARGDRAHRDLGPAGLRRLPPPPAAAARGAPLPVRLRLVGPSPAATASSSRRRRSSDYRWAAPDEAVRLLSGPVGRRVGRALAATGTLYLEDGRAGRRRDLTRRPRRVGVTTGPLTDRPRTGRGARVRGRPPGCRRTTARPGPGRPPGVPRPWTPAARASAQANVGSRLIPRPEATAAATARRSGATSRRSAWNGRPSDESQNRRVRGSSAL